MKSSLFVFLLSSLMLFSSCVATYKPIGASLKTTSFSNSSVDNVTLLFSDIDVQKKSFLNRSKNDISSANNIISEFNLKFDSLFLTEDIHIIIDNDSIYNSSQLEEFSKDIESLNKNYISNKKRHEGIIDKHPDFDISDSEVNFSTKYGIYISLKGSENTDYVDYGFGNVPHNTKYTTLISYIFDIEKNKVVWIYEYTEQSNIDKINIDSFFKSLLFSFKYEKDLKPVSFELEPSNKDIVLTTLDGTRLFGTIENVSHFNVSFKTNSGINSIHMKDIYKIEIPSKNKILFPFEI